jgi:hypothetical protein
VKALRVIVWALLGALLFGLLVGTIIRKRMEEPVRYIGASDPAPRSVPTSVPFDVADPGPGVLEPSPHEEQVG